MAYRYWTIQDEEKMRNEYGITPCKELSLFFGRSVKAVEKKAAKMGLKSKVQGGKMYANSHNKGKTWNPKEKHHMWRKVKEPWSDKKNVYIKPSRESKPVLFRRYLMVSLGHDIKGKHVIHKDKNNFNCNINNLEIITKTEHIKRNSITRFPSELQSIIHLLSKLKKVTNNAEK